MCVALLTCRTLCGAKQRLSLSMCNRTAGLVLAWTSSIRRDESHISLIFLPRVFVWKVLVVSVVSVSDICDFHQVLIKWLSAPSLTGRCPLEVISIQSVHFYPSSYGPLVRCQACAFSLLRPPSCCSLLPLHGHSFHLWWAVTRAVEKCRFKKRRMRAQGEALLTFSALDCFSWMSTTDCYLLRISEHVTQQLRRQKSAKPALWSSLQWRTFYSHVLVNYQRILLQTTKSLIVESL